MPNATLPAAPQRQTLFSALHSLADEIRTEKTAGAKTASGALPSDPGGYQGKSTHPSASADNHGEPLQTGSRASENESDVKEDQGAPGVDSTPEGVVKDQDGQQLNIGTEQSATGEDPSVEDDYKGDKDDPGTTHPAKATVGEKYGSVKFAEAKQKANLLANEILADLAVGFGSELTTGVKVAGKAPAAPKTAAANKSNVAPPAAAGAPSPAAGATPKTADLLKQASTAVASGQQAAVQAGYELAAALGIDKTAAANSVAATIDVTLQDAELDASLVGAYMTGYKQSQVQPSQRTGKQGADRSDAAAGEDHDKPGDAKSGAGESHGGGGGESGEGSVDGNGGGGGGGGGASLGDMLGGGSDPGAMMGGGGGGAPGGAPGGDDPMGGGAGGGATQEQALQELVSALAELGISPDMLAQMAGSAGGGAPGGAPPPMGGGAPPPMGGDPMMGGGAPPPPMGGGAPAGGAPPMGEGMKLASVAKAFMASGKYQVKEAAAGTPERALRDEMKEYIRDIVKTAHKNHM